MEEKLPVIFKLEGEEVQATVDNCGIVMFRDAPDLDYIDIWIDPEEPATEVKHHWIFGQREKLLWMGRIAVQKGDDRIIRLAEREYGSFRSAVGWNPQVLVEDAPREWEREIYAQSQANKLDDEWSHFDES